MRYLHEKFDIVASLGLAVTHTTSSVPRARLRMINEM